MNSTLLSEALKTISFPCDCAGISSPSDAVLNVMLATAEVSRSKLISCNVKCSICNYAEYISV